VKIREGYKQSEVGVIPEDWEVWKLKNCCTKITDGTHDTPKPIQNGTPFLTAIHVKENCIDFEGCYYLPKNVHDEIYRRCNPEKNDVLMVNIGAGVATTALVNVEYEFSLKNVALLKPDCKNLTGPFLNHYQSLAKNKISSSITSGGAQPFLSLGQIGDLQLPIPSLHEQTAIATALSDTDALIQSLEKLIAKKRAIKQGAMQELLTGKRRLPGFEGKKGLKKTEIGEIPVDWQLKPFSEVFNISGGYTASRDQLSDSGYCYLHYGDIHTSSKSHIDVKHEFLNIPKLDVAIGKVSTKSILSDGDVVFVDASEDDEGTSKHMVIRNAEGIPYISGLHTIVVKNKTDEIDNSFKEFCFQTPYIKKQFYFFAVGTKVSGISKTNIAKILLAYPEKNEQTAIATILSDMDSSLSALESKLSKYRAIKQGMMQELLTGKTRLV
jgi:type I restriction enzyme S subunit